MNKKSKSKESDYKLQMFIKIVLIANITNVIIQIIAFVCV